MSPGGSKLLERPWQGCKLKAYLGYKASEWPAVKKKKKTSKPFIRHFLKIKTKIKKGLSGSVLAQHV